MPVVRPGVMGLLTRICMAVSMVRRDTTDRGLMDRLQRHPRWFEQLLPILTWPSDTTFSGWKRTSNGFSSCFLYKSCYRICRNTRPGRLIFESNKKHSKTHQTPSVLCTPPPPLKNHSTPIGFMYSPLWKITHHNLSVLCTPPFEKSLFLVGAYFGVGVYLGKYGTYFSLQQKKGT